MWHYWRGSELLSIAAEKSWFGRLLAIEAMIFLEIFGVLLWIRMLAASGLSVIWCNVVL